VTTYGTIKELIEKAAEAGARLNAIDFDLAYLRFCSSSLRFLYSLGYAQWRRQSIFAPSQRARGDGVRLQLRERWAT